ncbi:hypothetical protein GTF97_07910 [Roseobacter sp. HKCCD8767]|uniref:hypothetical protein n=1 Tax=unclassified Roseobacter TaxID=196798 RepID=UPI00149270E1|nr:MULTISPECIES: hypothetical protein [unclassified Roseobacter]NNV68736.1 hypothetical protein [Roseobacter sp. HKCCD8474]NNV94520.1 hypothetical protein [Roseobacter sp. HKCCD8914]NNW11318.1 hypothetical protein [Roseobacter sp. HKCCD8484]NNW19839.1 hypothetical protein [Roseobacter sp. HKCCD7543]NNW41145.1 hypothetical protein [Roseobacter sp. HKCCD8654]NNW45528.1 hypothetical protein [Roseobacter sp. HKCCD8291]NNW79653.1 hypothetical protein [Roseobacter sp. HKCCD8134]NNW88171.1 hypothe
MTDAEIICDKLGRHILIESLGVSKAALSNALTAGVFPSRWFSVVKRECEKRDIPCPDAAFSFIKPATKAAPKNTKEATP